MSQPTEVASNEPSSNLATLRQVFGAGGFPSGLGRTLGIIGSEADEGRVLLVGAASEDHYNPLGSVHGGYSAAMLDSAISLAVYTVLPPGAGYTTTDLKIAYLRAVFAGSGPVHAEGRVINQGRRMVLGEARLTDRKGRLCAHATASCMIVEQDRHREASSPTRD